MNIENLCFFISFTHLVTYLTGLRNILTFQFGFSFWIRVVLQLCWGGGVGGQCKRASGVIKTIEVCL